MISPLPFCRQNTDHGHRRRCRLDRGAGWWYTSGRQVTVGLQDRAGQRIRAGEIGRAAWYEALPAGGCEDSRPA